MEELIAWRVVGLVPKKLGKIEEKLAMLLS